MSIRADVLHSYKVIHEEWIDRILKEEIAKNRKKLVVLDDDPTGVQTVHDVSVYTSWEKESIRQGFKEENRLFYILTNSRGLTARQTEAVHREIGKNVAEVAKEHRTDYIFISRSDSTFARAFSIRDRGIERMLRDLFRREAGRRNFVSFF